MIIIPAIDIIDNSPVRLKKGDYGTAHRVADSVGKTARRFEKAGAKYIHLVDLDGAKAKKPVNAATICETAKTVSVPVEVGGGIRNIENVEFYLQNGVSRVILGSAAVSDRLFLEQAVKAYGERIAVGVDALDRKVRTNGWLEQSSLDFIGFAKYLEGIGVRNIIFTDINRDGMLSGPNLEQLAELKSAVGCDITASGGVSSEKDVENLKALGLYAAITGKAIYSGSLSLERAIEIGER